MEVIGPKLERAGDCEAVLRSLPMWFGIERALLMYARDSATMPTFALADGSQLGGFLTLREHFPEAWLKARGVRFLQVKTVAATSSSREYAETREFYRHRGFTPIEVFPTLWDPHNPALQLIKVLNST